MQCLAVIMLCLWTITASQDTNIGFIEEPISTIAKIGDRVRLRCKSNSTDERITWYFNDVIIPEESESGSKRQRRKRNKDDPWISDPTATFDLNSAVDLFGTRTKSRTSYDSRFSKKFRRRKDRRKGKKRDKNPYTSLKRYVRSVDGNNGNVQVRSGRLSIQQFEKANVGTYHCVVTTPNGSIRSRNANVGAAELWEFSFEPLSTVTAFREENAVLPCTLPESRPRAEPRWQVDNASWITETTDHYTILPLGSLLLKNVTSDVGKRFQCCAYNPTMGDMKCAKGVTTLTVTDSELSEKNKIIFPLSRTTKVVVNEGNQVLLACIAKKSSTVLWEKDGSAFPRSAKITEDGLSFDNVLESDSGMYSCRLSEDSLQYSLNLAVTGKSIVSSERQENGNLRCSVQTLSNPKWTWYHNAKRIHNIDGEVLNASLVSSMGGGYYQCLPVLGGNLSDYAIFFVKGFNSVTISSTSEEYFTASTQNPGLPAPRITNPEGTSKPTSYKLTWEIDDVQSNLKLFSIKYYKLSSAGEQNQQPKVINLPANERSLVIDALFPQSTYVVKMISVYQNNLRSEEAISSFYTAKEIEETSSQAPVRPPPKVPRKDKKKKKDVPKAPTRPTVTTISADSVSLMWNRGGNGGSPIQGYRIESKRVTAKEEWETVVPFINTDYPPYELSGLERGMIYKFRIVAVNAKGDSLPSPPSRPYPRRPKPPIEPLVKNPFIIAVESQGETGIVITWQYKDYSPSSIGGYAVFYRSSESDNEDDYIEEKVDDGDATSCVIKGLEPEMQYDIKMRAYNKLGESPFSNLMSVELPGNGEVIIKGNGRRSTHARDSTTHGDSGHNDPARERAYHRNTIFLVSGAVIGAIVLVLLVTVFCYWRRKNNQNMTPEMKRPNGSAIAYNKGKYGNHLGMTKLNGNHSGSEVGTHTPNSYSQSPHDTRCQCSRHHSNHSSLERNGRDFCQCGIQPCNGHGGCSPHNGCWTPNNYPNIHSNPMQAYMDHRIPYYPHGLGRGMVALPPSWWLRGAGDFCHIVPGDARKMSGADEAGSEVSRGLAINGGHLVRTYVGNVTNGYYDDEINPPPDNGYHSNEDGLRTRSVSQGGGSDKTPCQNDAVETSEESSKELSEPQTGEEPEIRPPDVEEIPEEDSGRGDDITDDAQLNEEDSECLSTNGDDVDENSSFLNGRKETVIT